MEKREWEAWEIMIETVTVAAAIAFLGLQIYYGYLYEDGIAALFFRLLAFVLLYVGMTVLQIFPELLNGRSSEPLLGMVRTYAVRMVRNAKLLLVFGMLVPSVGDVLGIEMNAAYSLFIMTGILLDIGYYLYRIFQYNSKKKK